MLREEFFKKEGYKIIEVISGKLKQNCFIIKHLDSREIIVIDPGFREDIIINTLEREKGIIKYIFLTHAHYDHVGAVKEVSDHFSIPYYIHKFDLKLLRRASLYSISMENRDISYSQNFVTYDKEIYNWGGDEIKVTHTPGHTNGSVCLSFSSFIFSGDLILLSEDQSKLPGYEENDWKNSVQTVLKSFEFNSVFFPGHGKQMTKEFIQGFISNKLN
jgi:glyoxylase-like metal-dependent hydrolase (beta-lactamase superfamily II)